MLDDCFADATKELDVRTPYETRFMLGLPLSFPVYFLTSLHLLIPHLPHTHTHTHTLRQVN